MPLVESLGIDEILVQSYMYSVFRTFSKLNFSFGPLSV